MHTTIKHISTYKDKEVTLKGWLYNKRLSGKIAFLQFRDGTGIIQAIAVKNELGEELFEQIKNLTLESSIEITGKAVEDKRSPSGYEIQLNSLTIVHQAPDDYPIGKKEHGPDFLLSNRHLWLRSKRQWALMRIRHQITQSIDTFYQKKDFTKLDTPIITPAACEGTTTLFELDYFGENAYLSQSGQLYLEAAISSFGNVYDMAPVFRAEKSKTRRHLIEFWMTNAEMAYTDLDGIISIQEELIIYLLNQVLTNCQQELKLIDRDTAPLQAIQGPFPRITHQEAVKILQDMGSDIQHGEDFGADDETLLMNHYKQPLFITHYPLDVKAFYMKPDPSQPDKALCADLLAPEGYGEIIGGSQRIDDYDQLKQAMEKHNLPMEEYDWYLDLRKFGSVPHSGYGLGVERFIAWVCGLKHVRETIPFPRLLHRVRP